MQKPHLLYLAWGFPPSRAAGVFRALATANAFAAAGWRVTVVTADCESFRRYTGADSSLEERVADGVSVVRVPFVWPARETDIRRYSAFRAALPPVWNRVRGLLDRVRFPETSYGPWRGPLTRAVRSVQQRDPADLVIATANPYVTFAAAYDAHRRSGVPYVLDYRDAWRLDVFSGRLLTGRLSRVGRWEARVVGAASEVWFVNEPILSWHARQYPASATRMHVVANGWDPDLLGTVPLPRRIPEPGEGLRFAYLGTITSKVPVVELLEGWRLAVDEGAVPAGSSLVLGGHLGYFSVPQGDLSDVVRAAADVGVRYVGPVAKAGVRQFYAEADALVLALGSGRYVTSGKVYEYIATGRPIVAVHDVRNATSAVLADDPLVARATDLTPRGVASAFAAGARMIVDPATRDEAGLVELAEALRRDRQLTPRIVALTPGRRP